MKLKLTLFLQLLFSGFLFAQQDQLTFTHQNINFSAPPRTTINPMSIKMWDNYNNGGPTAYGTVMEFYGLSGHQTGQFYFAGWDNSKIRYREAFYSDNSWSNWMTLLDSKNNVESTGRLMITGQGNHYIEGGNVGIGTSNPDQKLTIKGGGIGFDNNSADKKLYSPLDGDLEWMTHTLAAGHGFAVSFQGEKRVYLNVAGNSYFNGGNVGIGTNNPTDMLTVAGKIGAREIKVSTNAGADFVFEPNYKLPDLGELEMFVKINKHLPEIPTAKEMVEKGVNLGELNIKLLQKVEELTLHLIEKDKQVENDASLIKNQQMQIDELKKGYLEIKKYLSTKRKN